MSTSDEGTVRFAVVSAATGLVLRVGGTDLDSLAGTAGGDDIVAPIPDDVGDETHRYDWSLQQFVPIPAKPGPWAEWDGTAWIDQRTDVDLAAEVQAARLEAVERINTAAGIVRRRYVTDIPGQEALYMMKEAEARAWVASADPDPALFPLIEAEIGITGTDAGQVAQVYLNLAGIYVQAAAQLETARLGHIAQAEAADTPEAAAAIAEAFRDLIGQLPV